MPSPAQELQRRLQHLELLSCIVMHATRGERGGQLVLEAEPTKLLTERRGANAAGASGGAAGTNGGAAGPPRLDAGASGGVPPAAPPAVAGGAGVGGPAIAPRARMLKRAATVPLRLDQQAQAGDERRDSEQGQQELTLRSLELSRLRLSIEVSRNPAGAGYMLRCGLSASLALELPTPWFVPRVAIEAAGSLLLKVGLKIGCDQLLHELEWLDTHERRAHPKLQSRSPSHSPR